MKSIFRGIFVVPAICLTVCLSLTSANAQTEEEKPQLAKRLETALHGTEDPRGLWGQPQTTGGRSRASQGPSRIWGPGGLAA